MRTAGDKPVKRVIILGSTGSIGTQTCAVIAHLNALRERGECAVRFDVVGLAAGSNAELLGRQASELNVRAVAIGRAEDASTLGTREVFTGPDAAERLVREVECDLVVAAMSGAAGLPATLAAASVGRDIALANKESLVAAGALIVAEARRTAARLLPVDSEHSAIWQCLGERAQARPTGLVPPCDAGSDIARIILTASGGPFRDRTLAQVAGATREQALAHPTWKMGAKVMLDSATLTNKGLEIVEAHWLFGLPSERIGVVIHPQSIVHSMVEFADGSVLAQLGTTDMRGPIQHALTFPARPCAPAPRLEWSLARTLEFFPADESRFEPLALARRAIDAGGTSGAIFNAASEEAGRLFLDGHPGVRFGMLPELARGAMDAIAPGPLTSLGDALEADSRARAWVRRRVGVEHACPT